MPMFVCDDCGHVDNTATGRWWSRNCPNLWAADNLGKALCSLCEPTTFVNGEPNEDGGKWHGRFERRLPTEEGIAKGIYINRGPNRER